MRVLTAPQLRALDERTVLEAGISSTDLMERAASAFTGSFVQRFPVAGYPPVVVLCGSGNNGGDGLVAARLLAEAGYQVNVVALIGTSRSSDFAVNWQRAGNHVSCETVDIGDTPPTLAPGAILIDALFGTGLSRPLEGHYAKVVDHFNGLALTRVALDVPSGLQIDAPSEGPVIHADVTFTLGYPKAGLFAPENAVYIGELVIVPFPLADAAQVDTVREDLYLPVGLITREAMRTKLTTRTRADHKGTFGHALLVAGSFGKMGAAVIAARAVLRSGAGLVTCHVPRSGYEIMQISFPEAMCSVDAHRYHFTEIGPMDVYRAVGIGPGLGKADLTAKALENLLRRYERPMVLDADALNIVAEHPQLLDLIPKQSILTPHPKEFERLFGSTADSFARWRVLSEMARSRGLIILVKTAYTSIGAPDGRIYLNTTGNPGMGTAGTGDALTGILTGLLAQGYAPLEAAKLGVYLHGLAGDIAAEVLTQEFLLAEDVVNHLGAAYRRLRE